MTRQSRHCADPCAGSATVIVRAPGAALGATDAVTSSVVGDTVRTELTETPGPRSTAGVPPNIAPVTVTTCDEAPCERVPGESAGTPKLGKYAIPCCRWSATNWNSPVAMSPTGVGTSV